MYVFMFNYTIIFQIYLVTLIITEKFLKNSAITQLFRPDYVKVISIVSVNLNMNPNFCCIVSDPQMEQIRSAAAKEKQERLTRRETAKVTFFNSQLFSELSHISVSTIKRKQVSGHLKHWIEKLSWTRCHLCFCLCCQTLKPNFIKRPVATSHVCSNCTRGNYSAPNVSLWPDCLKGLTQKEHRLLSPFNIDCGQYCRKQHGYRIKTGGLRITKKATNVEQAIASVNNDQSRRKLHLAYEFLVNCRESSYKKICRICRKFAIRSNLAIF
ncbi:uncharacterized protein LOC144745821 isoform X1 [Ciona intestinalis]